MKMRKLLAIVMTLALVMSFSVGALAVYGDGSGKITVQNVKDNTVLNVYRILSMKYNDDYDATSGSPATYSKVEFTADEYRVAFVSAIQEIDSTFVLDTRTDLELFLYVTNTADLQTSTFGEALGKELEKAVSGTPYASKIASDSATAGAYVFSGVEDGYYLILDDTTYLKGSASAMLSSVQPNVTVYLKSTDFPDIEKETSAINVYVGDSIPYTITLPVPQFSAEAFAGTYTIKDTLGVGATAPSASEFSVTMDSNTLTLGTDYTIDIDKTSTDGSTIITIAFTGLDIDDYRANIGKDIVISYSAIVNEDATEDGIVNKVVENNYFGNFREEEITSYTYGFEVDKYDGDNNLVKLEGVEFKVYTENASGAKTYLKFSPYAPGSAYNYYYDADVDSTTANESIFTDADGLIKAWGLAAGTYYLEEIDTNDGYNLLDKPEKVVISELSGTSTVVTLTKVEVKNFTGIQIPGTGGIGTTLFTIFGGVIILGAFTLLIANRKRIFGK